MTPTERRNTLGLFADWMPTLADRFIDWMLLHPPKTFEEAWATCPTYMWMDDVVEVLENIEKSTFPSETEITDLRTKAVELRMRHFTSDAYSKQAQELYRTESAVSLIGNRLLRYATSHQLELRQEALRTMPIPNRVSYQPKAFKHHLPTMIGDVKLWPILEAMDICAKAWWWLDKSQYATFEEAWADCPSFFWLDYVVKALGDGDDDDHIREDAWANYSVVKTDRDGRKAYQRPEVMARVKQMMLDYHKEYVAAPGDEPVIGELRLLPILRFMLIGNECLTRIHARKYQTFESFWADCDRHKWMECIIHRLDALYPDIEILREENKKIHYTLADDYRMQGGRLSYYKDGVLVGGDQAAVAHYKTVSAAEMIKSRLIEFAKHYGIDEPCATSLA